MSTYIGLKLDRASSSMLKAWIMYNNFNCPVCFDDFHATVICDRNNSVNIEWAEKPNNIKVFPEEMKFSVLGTALVIILENKKMYDLHDHYKNNYGLVHNFDEFIPHITVSYFGDETKKPSLIDFPLTFNKEYKTHVIESWFSC